MRGLVAVAVAAAMVSLPAGASGATGRVLVTLAPGSDLRALEARAGVRADGPRIPQLSAVTVRPVAGVGVDAALRRLRSDPAVGHAEAEHRAELRRLPSDPALTARDGAGVPLQWALLRAGFPRAWAAAPGDGAVVAVLDTGVEASHPDLAGKVAGAIDVDGRGTEATTDHDGHGTHVGSIACAATDNGIGIAGAGHHCRLLVLKTDLTDASIAKGIVTAADAGAHALNMSFGDDGRHPSRLMSAAVEYAVARGVVLVAAAADEPVREQGEPASLLQPDGTGPALRAGRGLTVTAATIAGRRAGFAGHGTQVSLASYGVSRDGPRGRGILGLYPARPTPREWPEAGACDCRTSLGGDDRYAQLAGTSMAAPQVAAAAALVRSLNPDLSALDVVRLLKRTARGRSWNPDVGWGVLDAGAAVEAARRVDRRAPDSLARAAGTARDGRHRLAWRGHDAAPAGLLPSGVARYELWRTLDGGPAHRVAVTAARGRYVRVPAGRTAGFFTVAVDRAGNREAAPGAPDVTLAG